MATVLILTVASTSDGLCIAGMTAEPHPVTGLRWVRLVRTRGAVRMEDLTTADNQTIRPFDVVEFNLIRPRPVPPQTEDWIADLDQDRPRILRRLEGERRSRFLRARLDSAPREVLDRQRRSLCLIKPALITGSFRRDPGSAYLDARLAFRLDGRAYRGTFAKGGLAVSDLEWLALGASWLPEGGGWIEFDTGDLEARRGIGEICLVVGLVRSHQRRFEPAILGVHTLCP
jgi:hypothetical protein